MSEFEYAIFHAGLAFIMGCALAYYGDDLAGWLFASFSVAMAAMHVRLGFKEERERGRA